MLYVLSVLLAGSTLALLAGMNAAVSVTVPTDGGSLTEGVLGPARFVNPVLSISGADEDLSALVYSGLMRSTPDGTVVSDLASNFDVSEDGTTYTFTIRTEALFHDGEAVTSSDVRFTIQKIQDPAIKSPRRADWEGVTVSTPDSHTVVFKLPRAYAPFLQNTTLGILPEHLWHDTKAEDFPFHALNTHPVGSGPFAIDSVDTDTSGSATRFVLSAFRNYALGRPHLNSFVMRIYPSDDTLERAFNRQEIDAIAGIPASALKDLSATGAHVMRISLPRVFGVFFNQGHAVVLADSSVREALDAAVDKHRLVDIVLGGYGEPLTGPIPPGVLDRETISIELASTTPISTAYTQETLDKARTILSRGGWKYDEATGTWTKNKQQLAFTLATGDAPELTATANAVATAWRQAGAKVTMQVYPLSELNINVIRPREYDAVLFGEVVGRELDLFAFWHSSQRNDPGLNLALYATVKADTLLSQARATTDKGARDKLYREFADLIEKEKPAVFLYAPEFLYAVPRDMHGIELGALTTPAERFLNVHEWYRDTERVWNIFTNESAE